MPQPLTVRVTYVVPDDAVAWDQAEERAIEVVKNLQLFFAFEMKRCNYDPKTFKIEDSQTFFHQREPPMTTNKFGPSGKNAINACRKAIGEPDMGYAELCFIESYSFNNGVLSGAVAKTWHRRSCLSSLYLKVSLREWIDNDDEYCGKTFPWINSQPLTNDSLAR